MSEMAVWVHVNKSDFNDDYQWLEIGTTEFLKDF